MDRILSAAEHAAKRETEKMYRQCFLHEDANDALHYAIDIVSDRFRRGKKMDDKSFAVIVHQLRKSVTEGKPVLLDENVGGKISNKVWELRALSRSALVDNANLFFIVSLRVAMSKKKMVIETCTLPIVVKRHLMERAIERSVAKWTDGLIEIENSLLDHTGLAVTWAYAFREGLIDSPHIQLPVGDGVVLGTVLEVPRDYYRNDQMKLSRDAGVSRVMDPDELTKSINGEQIQIAYSTIINDDILRQSQLDLKGELEIISIKYKSLFSLINKMIFWRGSEIDEVFSFEEIKPGLDAVAADIAEIVNQPQYSDCLRGPSEDAIFTGISTPAAVF